MTTRIRLAPLAAWLTLGGAIVTLFPITFEIINLILVVTVMVSLVWLPGRRLRSVPFLALYVVTALLAIKLPLPLPTQWHPLQRLLFTLSVWSTLLVVLMMLLLVYLLRTARAKGPQKN